jgi:hypothetical protein
MPGDKLRDRGETTENSALVIQREIDELLKAIQTVNNRLARLQTGWLNPPEPNRPGIRDGLNSIKSQAENVIRVSDALLARMT